MSRNRARAALLACFILVGVTPALAQDWRTITSLRQFRGEQQLDVKVEYGAGNLTIGPGSGNSLYKATLRYDANAFKPVTHYTDGRLRVGVEGGSVKGRHLKSGRLDLTLGNHVPMDMDLKFGAVHADVELGGMRIRQLHVATGASETELVVSTANPERCSDANLEVGAAEFKASGLGNLNCEHFRMAGGVGDVTLDFNGAWRSDASVDIDMGLGSLEVRVPRGLGVSVRKKGVLSSFDSQELIKRGDTYYSENWDKATRRVTFNIDAALGSIRMVWVDPETDLRKAQR